MERVNRQALSKIEAEFGFKQKKKNSERVNVNTWTTPSRDYSNTDTDKVLRKAVLSAATSPYLRAIAILTENEKEKSVTFFEIQEHGLSRMEKTGVLIQSKKKMLAIKELGSTHVLQVDWIVKTLFEHLHDREAKNIHVINIHHDYLRSFYETPILIDNTLWNLLENNPQEKTSVIRITEKGGQGSTKKRKVLSREGNTDNGNGDVARVLEVT